MDVIEDNIDRSLKTSFQKWGERRVVSNHSEDGQFYHDHHYHCPKSSFPTGAVVRIFYSQASALAVR